VKEVSAPTSRLSEKAYFVPAPVYALVERIFNPFILVNEATQNAKLETPPMYGYNTIQLALVAELAYAVG
jgi:hypothetical protein